MTAPVIVSSLLHAQENQVLERLLQNALPHVAVELRQGHDVTDSAHLVACNQDDELPEQLRHLPLLQFGCSQPPFLPPLSVYAATTEAPCRMIATLGVVLEPEVPRHQTSEALQQLCGPHITVQELAGDPLTSDVQERMAACDCLVVTSWQAAAVATGLLKPTLHVAPLAPPVARPCLPFVYCITTSRIPWMRQQLSPAELLPQLFNWKRGMWQALQRHVSQAIEEARP